MKYTVSPTQSGESEAPTWRELFFAFLMIALSGFGGVLPWARRILVEDRGWLTAEMFNDTLALCQSLPGPNIVNLSVVVGARFAGPGGAIAAVSGLVGAPVAIVIGLAALHDRFGGVGRTPEAIAAMGAAASGLVAATAAKMARPIVNSRPLSAGALIVGAFAGAGLLRAPLPWVLLVLAPLGAAAAWFRRGPGPAR